MGSFFSGNDSYKYLALRRDAMILTQTNESIMQASNAINRGGVIAFRTDTFYGLGADPFNVSAVQRIKKLKGREENKPILIVISDRDQVKRFIPETTSTFDVLANAFWPGPLTLIGKAVDELPEEITAGTETVGLRLPNDDMVRALVRECGGALTATSANTSGHPPATCATQVGAYFGKRLDLIIDGDNAQIDKPSTVVDASGPEPTLIREGAISWAEIRDTLQNRKQR